MAGDLMARERGELRQSLDWKLLHIFTVGASSQREKKGPEYDEHIGINGFSCYSEKSQSS